jgi:hypothetical protein
VLSQPAYLFLLPRVKVEDWDGDALARLLSDAFHPVRAHAVDTAPSTPR